MDQWNDQGWKKALEYFQQAVNKDPNYAAAWAGLSDAYAILGYQYDLPPKKAYQDARTAAERALAIDENSAEGHAALGISYWVDRDFSKPEPELRRAIELNPNLALAHEYYSWFLASLGRFSEAQEQNAKAQELDPLSLGQNSWAGQIHLLQHDFDSAIAKFKRILETDPNYANAHLVLGDAYFAKGMCHEGQQEASNYMTLMGFADKADPGARAYATAGCNGFLRLRIQTESDAGQMDFYYPSQVAEDYARMGDKDAAFAWLDRCYQEGAGINFVKFNPAFDGLHSDPRFADLLRRMGLPN
jgi:tetratricopeptide (TPR) repeat protein